MSLQNLQFEFLESVLSENRTMMQIKHEQNMLIYRNNIITQHVKTLHDIYPLIVALVGEDFFHHLAQEYVKCYPSSHPNLNCYGEYLSHFLKEHSSLQDYPYMKEVAEFEWICHTLYFAENSSIFPLESLKRICPENYDELHFTMNPASRLMKFQYPILKIIDLCHAKIESLNIDEESLFLLVIRRDLDIVLVPLSESEFIFLKMLQDEQSLSQALTKTLEIDSNFQLEEKILHWIRDKTIVNFYLENTIC